MSQDSIKPAWLEDAVFYEIYPQSFYDSNGDGIGDIPGILAKLDYLQSLGINALWLNPCFESPFMDAGYDVSDYYKVAPRYGTNDDLRALFVQARQRGIRILLDLVPGHTSIEHPWFKASCRHEQNEYTDWFIWTDSVWSPIPPNLRGVNGFAERDGNYITNFFYSQPALNYGFANPDPNYPWQQSVEAPGPQRVRQAIKNIMRFWLDMGASGFRVDMAFSLVKGDTDGKAIRALWQEVRAWLDAEYPHACLVSEWSRPDLSIVSGFHADFLLHFNSTGYTALFRKSYGKRPRHDPYGFSFFDRAGHGNICEFLDEYLAHYDKTKGKGVIAIPTGNHDMSPRISQGRERADLEVVYMFLLTMPGTPFIYYGDEIGMRTIGGLPSKEGGYHRTGSRTPMQWANTLNAGFSTASAERLYLPVDAHGDRPTVADQDADSGSLLNTVRRLIALRKSHPALCASGDFVPIYAGAGKYPFVYQRTQHDEVIVIAVNPSAQSVDVELPDGLMTQLPETLYGQIGAIRRETNRWVLRLPGVSGGVYKILK